MNDTEKNADWPSLQCIFFSLSLTQRSGSTESKDMSKLKV